MLLVPVMMLCAAPRYKPKISGEAVPLLVSALLGLSNGVLGSVPMILAPTKVEDELRELTGNIMTLSYFVGLTIGSCVAYGLDDILGPPLSDPCKERVSHIFIHHPTPASAVTTPSYLLHSVHNSSGVM